MRVRWIFLAVIPWALWGCPSLNGVCNSNSDCGAGEYCSETSHSCIQSDDGGVEPDAGHEPDGGVCITPCADAEECMDGLCVPRYSALNLTAPATGTTVKPGTMVEVKAVLVLAQDRTANPPEQLDGELTKAGGATEPFTLTKSGEEYAATVPLPNEGSYSIVAKLGDALTSEAVTVNVDGTEPTLHLDVQMPPNRPAVGATTYEDPDSSYAVAFRRDESVPVKVWSEDADVAGETVQLSAKTSGGAAKTIELTTDTGCPSAAKFCTTAQVKLWELEMPAFHDTVTFTLTGQDAVGNEAEQKQEARKVTRFKWAYQVDTAPVKASPAVASDGTIVVGSTNGGTGGNLVAVNPDGTKRWDDSTLGALDASPSIGEVTNGKALLYLGLNASDGANFEALELDTHSSKKVCGPYPGTSLASPGIFKDPSAAGAEAAAIHINDADTGSLIGLRPGAGQNLSDCIQTGMLHNVNKGSAVSLDGTDAYFLSSSSLASELHSLTFTSSHSWATRAGFPISGTNILAHGLALTGAEIVGGGDPVFAVALTGGTPWTGPAGSQAWNPVVSADGFIFVGDDANKLWRAKIRDSMAVTNTSASGNIHGAPLLGEGGLLYVGTSAGTLEARNSADLSSVWSWSGTAAMKLGTIESSPNIDCTRNASGAKVSGAPGVLYFGSNNGKLYAIIVDSRGIDTTAPWPKYQHDPRNTGNADTPWTEFACP